MTYVVTDNCVKCKYTDCVAVCPVDCFHEGPNFLAINPEGCIDCNLCMPVCPAGAIFPDDEVPQEMEAYIQLNVDLAKQWPVIKKRIDPPEDAEKWDGIKNKLQYLEYS